MRVAPAPWATWWARVVYALPRGAGDRLVVWSVQQRKLRREAEYAQRLQVEVRDRTLELAERNRELENLNLQLKEASLTDPLTGPGARGNPALSCSRCSTQFVSAPAPPGAERRRHAATPQENGVLMVKVDLDYLKPDQRLRRHGHQWGRAIGSLTQVARIFCRPTAAARATDAVRWGGDEFCQLPTRTPILTNAEGLAEERPLACRQTDLPPGRLPSWCREPVARSGSRAIRSCSRHRRVAVAGSSACSSGGCSAATTPRK